jgi:prepilin signal peptidase PulO-like enzyme (type II secretory pathway)
MEYWIVAIGLLVGPAVNYAIYQFAYGPRPISPWQRRDSSWLSRLPIVGWFFRGRDRQELGRWFWIRPMLIELAIPIALFFLYQHVMGEGMVFPGGMPVSKEALFASFVCVSLLLMFLIAATFIDFDERTIPDLITVPGTWIGFIGTTLVPNWRLREIDPASFLTPPILSRELHANSAFDWPYYWSQGGDWGLLVGLMLWGGWCFALLNRRWITRRGLGKAWIYFWAGLARDVWTVWVGAMGVLGVAWILGTYYWGGPQNWEGLLTSLFGIGLGGLLVWSFRLVAALVMGREALGFGDVTLMAMVGAFVGWQVVWISFFVSPFFALFFVILFWVITRDSSTPFGPYLSMGVIYVLWDWARLWNVLSTILLPPELLLLFWGLMLLALASLLGLIEFVKKLTRSREG